MHHDFRRFLIVRTDRIGDLILTLPMAQVIKRQFPAAKISILLRHYTSEIAQYDRHIDQILYYDNATSQIPFLKLAGALRSEKFDVVFHTHPRFRLALMTRLAGIPVRVGTGYRWYSFLFNRKVYEHRKTAARHELEYNLNLLAAIQCPVDSKGVTPTIEVQTAASERVNALLAQRQIAGNSQLVILHPGSGGSARDWRFEKFGALGKQLNKLNDVTVVVTGGGGEEELVQQVSRLAGPRTATFVDALTLQEYAALARRASLFVANSTGPIHVAAAVGTPVIGFYPQHKPLSAARWGPYTERKVIFTPKNQPDDCKRCLRRPDRYCECMDSITVEEVLNAAHILLREGVSTQSPARHHFSGSAHPS